MNLLGLDLASRLTGWCCGDGAQLPHCGAWEFDPCEGDYGKLLAQLEDYLNVAHRRFAFTAVAYEAPLLVTRKYRDGHGQVHEVRDKLSTLRLLYPLGAFVEWWSLRQGLPYWEVSVTDIKKEVTGNVYAVKDDLVAIARKVGLELPAGEGAKDAADAWGAWLLLLRYMEPELSRAWDSRIWRPRGTLL